MSTPVKSSDDGVSSQISDQGSSRDDKLLPPLPGTDPSSHNQYELVWWCYFLTFRTLKCNFGNWAKRWVSCKLNVSCAVPFSLIECLFAAGSQTVIHNSENDSGQRYTFILNSYSYFFLTMPPEHIVGKVVRIILSEHFAQKLCPSTSEKNKRNLAQINVDAFQVSVLPSTWLASG